MIFQFWLQMTKVVLRIDHGSEKAIYLLILSVRPVTGNRSKYQDLLVNFSS